MLCLGGGDDRLINQYNYNGIICTVWEGGEEDYERVYI